MKRIITILLLVLLLAACGKKESDQQFKCGDMSVYLPASYGFEKVDNQFLDMCLYSKQKEVGVYASRHDKKAISESANSDSITLHDFAEAACYQNEILLHEDLEDCIIVGFEEAEGDYMVYDFNAFYETEDSYWWLTFDCHSKRFEEYRSTFYDWARKVKFGV